MEKGKCSIEEIKGLAEDLKAEIWSYLEDNKLVHKGLKEYMNDVLDCLDECPDYCDKDDK